MSRLPNVLEALAIMRLNPGLWSEANDAIVMSWVRQFLQWYSSSLLGTQAKAAFNNIALWYYQVRVPNAAACTFGNIRARQRCRSILDSSSLRLRFFLSDAVWPDAYCNDHRGKAMTST
jgi:hypothetical protein